MKTMAQSRTSWFILWITFGLWFTPAAGSQMKARVAWTSFASNMSSTWVAQEEGVFKKNGLEVELVHVPSTSRAIQTLLAGELGVHLYGRSHRSAGDVEGRRRGYRRRRVQPLGVFSHGAA